MNLCVCFGSSVTNFPVGVGHYPTITSNDIPINCESRRERLTS